MSTLEQLHELRVSVCIPTCSRPALIVRAVASVLGQTKLPFEILIGDDSEDDATAEAVERMQAAMTIPIRLFRNQPRLGQGRNVGNLIEQAEGDAILLLHDDDRVEPRGIEILAEALLQDDVILAFGKSWVVDAAGKKDRAATDSLNACYYRTPDRAGIVIDTLAAAAVQQVPGSGFMVRTSAARQASYDEAARYFNACDYVFNVELAARTSDSYYFCDEFVHCYHHTPLSLSKSSEGNSAVMAFAYAHSLVDQLDDCAMYRKWMNDRAVVAIGQAARLGLLGQAVRWFFGPFHRSRIVSLVGLRSACKIGWAWLQGRHRNAARPPIPAGPNFAAGEDQTVDHDAAALETLGQR